MKQLTQSEIRKNGKVYKNVSSPATEGTMKQVTDIVEKDGTFSISTDGGKTYSPAGDAVPEALPQEASALKSGNLPTSGWEKKGYKTFWQGNVSCPSSSYKLLGTSKELADILYADSTAYPIANCYGRYMSSADRNFSYIIGDVSYPAQGKGYRLSRYSSDPTIVVTQAGDIYAKGDNGSNTEQSVTYNRIGTSTVSQQFYTISDTSITVNSDVLMELTDKGGVKSYSMEAGKITVIRDTVPTQPIPYTYKVKQTNASGQFTVLNHFVPSIPESPTSLPVTYKKVSGSLPTSGWENEVKNFIDAKTLDKATYYTTTSKTVTIYPSGYTQYIRVTGWEVYLDGEWHKLTQVATAKYAYNDYNVSYLEAGRSAIIRYEPSGVYAYYRIYEDGHVGAGTAYNGDVQMPAFRNTEITSGQSYTISDTFITANTSVKMYLTDAGGVKAQSKTSGSITVIRDTVPTTAIPYEYEVEQTSAEGLFEVINAYVPAVPTKTSELTNDSGFLTKNNIVAGDNVTVTDENGNVKISATGGGSGAVTYTKLTGSVDFTTTAYTDDPYFLGQNAATWSENSAVGNKALTSTTDIGLFIGTSYTMTVNIQGTSTIFTAKAEDGSSYGLRGSKVLWFKRDDKSSQFFIYDHCTIVGGNIQAGNGCIFVADLGSDITTADINYFSGNRGVITPVTITNSAIKINSAVTMYINSSLVVSGTKTDGSITLTASTEGSVSYEMEILNTSTEGLFEVINAYVPDVPTKTSQLENDSGFITSNDIPTIPTKTSELTNDSGFAKTTEANTWTGEQTFSNENGIKTNRVHNLNGNAWYDFDGTNDRLGSLATPTIVRTSEARPKAEVPSGSATAIKELALLEDIKSVGEWRNWSDSSTLTEEGLYELKFVQPISTGDCIIFFVEYKSGQRTFYGTSNVSVPSAGNGRIVVTTPSCSGDGKLKLTQTLSDSPANPEELQFFYRKIN